MSFLTSAPAAAASRDELASPRESTPAATGTDDTDETLVTTERGWLYGIGAEGHASHANTSSTSPGLSPHIKHNIWCVLHSITATQREARRETGEHPDPSEIRTSHS